MTLDTPIPPVLEVPDSLPDWLVGTALGAFPGPAPDGQIWWTRPGVDLLERPVPSAADLGVQIGRVPAGRAGYAHNDITGAFAQVAHVAGSVVLEVGHGAIWPVQVRIDGLPDTGSTVTLPDIVRGRSSITPTVRTGPCWRLGTDRAARVAWRWLTQLGAELPAGHSGLEAL